MLKLEMCFVNIYIQNSLTKYGFFFIVFFPHARPPPPPLKKNIKMKAYFYNLVV